MSALHPQQPRRPLSRRFRPPTAAIGLVLCLSGASAVRADTPQQCIALWNGLARAQQAAAGSSQAFMAACLAYKASTAPLAVAAPDGAPAGATARCGDGTYSTASRPQGMCVGHHGIRTRYQ